MAEPNHIPGLSIFWRRGRKAFVELTAEEVKGAGVNPRPLLTAGLIQSGRIAAGSLTTIGYTVTDAGKALFADHMTAERLKQETEERKE